MQGVRFGIEVGNFSWPIDPSKIPDRLGQLARTIEGAGFDSLWLWDHFAQWSRQWDEPFLESWTTMGYLASATRRISLGVMVSAVTHRFPAVLVKQGSTLDVLTGGRSYFGIGAGWNAREHEAFGMPFPPLQERFALLEDALRIAHRAWAGERGEFRGNHVWLSEQVDSPSPTRKPHPPILIGGGGEQRTLKLVAQYGDASNFGTSPDELRHKIQVLRKHCADVDRDADAIERTTTIQVPNSEERTVATAGSFAKHVGEMLDAGAQHIIFGVPDGAYEHGITWLTGNVLPRVDASPAESSP